MCGVNLDTDPKTVRGNLRCCSTRNYDRSIFHTNGNYEHTGWDVCSRKKIRNQEILNTLDSEKKQMHMLGVYQEE